MARWAYIRRFELEECAERFVLARNKNCRRGWVYYWHFTEDGHEYVFGFYPNEKYNKRSKWSKELFLELEEDLRSAKPSVKVVIFAVNGNVFFSENGTGATLPAAPDRLKKNSEGQLVPQSIEEQKAIKRKLEHRKRMEAIAAMEEMNKEKPPYWLYGKFTEDGKEFTWKLNPDVPERQGIQPGDWVLVWSRDKYVKAKCTRIEKVDRRKKQPEHPKYSVKKKL